VRKHLSPRCMMKIDLKKAYDSVQWEAVREILTSLKFLNIFIKWIMACITSASFTIHINGDDFRSFKGGTGLRQGGPLSTLLFVLVMEYLTRLFNQAGSTIWFKFHPHCKDNRMTHLIFTDDLIVYSAAEANTIASLKKAFDRFSESTGLVANNEKSKIVMGGCHDQLKKQILELTGY